MDISEAKRLKSLETENAKLTTVGRRHARQRGAEGSAIKKCMVRPWT
jgi:hypothetical protein